MAVDNTLETIVKSILDQHNGAWSCYRRDHTNYIINLRVQ